MQNKKNFQQKFSKYIDSRLNNQRKKQLFAEQFNSPSEKRQTQSNTSIFPFSGLKTKNFEIIENQSAFEGNQLRKARSFENSMHKISKQRRTLEQSSQVKRKKLKKMKQLEQNVCPICLDQITKRCQLDCKHKFCLECLQKWLQTSNKCPFCRFEATSYWYQGEQHFIERIQDQEDSFDDFSEDEDLLSSQSNQSILDYTCYNCDQTRHGDVVLICDRCEVNACHVECDQSLRGRVPREDWYCHFCR